MPCNPVYKANAIWFYAIRWELLSQAHIVLYTMVCTRFSAWNSVCVINISDSINVDVITGTNLGGKV